MKIALTWSSLSHVRTRENCAENHDWSSWKVESESEEKNLTTRGEHNIVAATDET